MTDEQLSDWREIIEDEEYDDKDKTEDNEGWLSSMLATPGKRREAAKALLGGCPGLRDCFAFAIRSRLAEAPHTLDLECFQHWKHLISPRFNKGSHGCRHVIILAA